MPSTLPLVPSIPFYRVGTTLNNVQYLLDITWNGRDGAWYMSILDADANPIAMGLKLVLGSRLGRTSAAPNFPDGAIVLQDTSGNGVDAMFDDLGTRVIAIYFTPTELANGT